MSIVDDNLKPTRANLMELEEKIKQVEGGKRRLEKIQERLINKFMSLFDEWQEEADDVSSLFEVAEKKSAMARASDGEIAIRGAASARSEPIEIESRRENIAGVTIPRFDAESAQMELEERGYGIVGTNSRIDETAREYEELVDEIIAIAELKTSMKNLLDEIEKNKRRINAFEYQVLPDMREQKDEIQQALMEQERQEIYTLKKIKDKKSED